MSGDLESRLGIANAYVEALEDRLAALDDEAKQARENEAWANKRTVLVEFQPVTSGWYASAPDGVVGISATAPTIHAALRALRAKVEGGTR